MVRDEGSFVSIDSERFCDPTRALTSEEYRARYSVSEAASG
jgi:hypothetical protein